MSLPSGLLFFLDFKFDRNKSGATAGGSVYGTLEDGGANNNTRLDGVGAQTADGGFYNFNSIGYSRRNFILTNSAPTYAAETTTSELLNGATVSGFTFTLSDAAATDLANPIMFRVATSGEAESGNNGETFRGLRAIERLSGTSRFAQLDPTLTKISGSNVTVFLTTAGAVAAPNGGIDLSWDPTNASLSAAVLVFLAQTNVSVDNGTNNLGVF